MARQNCAGAFHAPVALDTHPAQAVRFRQLRHPYVSAVLMARQNCAGAFHAPVAFGYPSSSGTPLQPAAPSLRFGRFDGAAELCRGFSCVGKKNFL